MSARGSLKTASCAFYPDETTNIMPKYAYLPFVFCLATACTSTTVHPDPVPDGGALFTSMPADQTGIDFVNQVTDGEQFNVLTYRNFYNGGGVAIGDINNDGMPDLYLTANMGPNKLYLNRGDWKFEDITQKAGVAGKGGWSTGVAMADVNGDGWLDIYVCNSGDIAGDDKENELFINSGNAAEIAFTEQAAAYRLNDPGFTTHASFFDYDLDGDLDCYILNNSYKDPERIDAFNRTREEKDPLGGDKLFRNDSPENAEPGAAVPFTDVTEQAGIYNSPIGFGLGVSVSDLNGDMRPDIYISNDFWERDYLYLNRGPVDGKGTVFSEELTSRISLCSVSSMGADIADLNNDGAFDVFTTDMLPADNYRLKATTVFDPFHLEDYKYRADYHYQILQNCLQLNDGEASFQELSNLAGVSATDWSWGALIFDFDNDGWKDIFVSNALYKEIMYLDFTNFINDKDEVKKIVTEKGKFDWRDFAAFLPSNPLSNYGFVHQTGNSPIPQFKNMARELGLGEPGFSNGAAYGDLDGDGDLDLVVNNVNMPCFVYRNETDKKTGRHYLKIRLHGNGKNPFGVGAKVEIRQGDRVQALQHFPQRGFESSVEPGLLFGLPDNAEIDRLEVIWPDKKMQTLEHISVDQTLDLRQSDADRPFSAAPVTRDPFYRDATAELLRGNIRHQENRFNDFNYEILLPRMLSTESPKIIKGDLNGDGKEDFVLTGAAGDPDKMFIQQNGTWQEVTGWQPEADRALETTCGLIFDADGDGDNDLLLGAGGNEMQRGFANFRLRYYDNDGSGRFKAVEGKTPPAAGMVSCIVPGDIDLDGDLDLFIGGRAVPGNYGLMPRSFLLLNEGGGRWVDVTRQELGNCGMVTDACFTDTDNDGDQDLIVIGDWLPVLHFENDFGRFVFSKKQTAQPYYGWWTCLEPADLDGDGDLDFVLGNWGLNTKLKASKERPVTMAVKDFDNNGKSELILNWYPPNDDQPWPFAGKMDMTQQLPFLKKKALKFEDYAHLTYETMFDPAQRQGAVAYTANWLQTSVLWNDGSGFRLEALPLEAQVAPAFGIIAQDLDGDNLTDIWLGGNFYGLKPEVGRHDSSRGVFLRGDGKGGFTCLPPADSGLFVKGEVRDAATFQTANGPIILVARNDADALAFKRVNLNF